MVKAMMKKMLVVTAVGMLISTAAQAETIFDAMTSAYNTNPVLHSERAASGAINEDSALARSGYRPIIGIEGSYSDTHIRKSHTPTVDGYTKGYGGVISQPIFNGFQTYNGVKAADNAAKAELNNLYSIEQEVLLAASSAYLDVVRDEAIVRLQKNNEHLLKKQLDETLARFDVGEVTRTDVAQSRASYAQAQSDVILAEGNLAISKANYFDITGRRAENVRFPDNLSPLFPTSMEAALTYARSNNYALLAAQKSLKAAEYNVSKEQGALLPEVAFTASKGKTITSSHIGPDPTTRNTQYTVDMSMPLYSGGATRAAIRKSKYKHWQAQENLRAAESGVELGVTSSWALMQASKANISSIKEQVRASAIALEGTQKEEQLGNRTILDVLNAYQTLLISQVSEVSVRHDYYVYGLQLLQSMGKLTARKLNLPVQYYDAEKHYQNTKHKWLTLSIDK